MNRSSRPALPLLALSAVATVGILAGCTADAPGASNGAEEAVEIKVALNWSVPEYTHSGVVQAAADGLYDDANLEIELLPLAGSTLAVQTVASGAADIGFAGAEAILAGAAEGLPITVVANHLQESPFGVLYRGDTEITDFEQLAGMSIAVSASVPDTIGLVATLESIGIDPERDVELTYVDPGVRCQLMLSGTTDACTGFSTGQLVRALEEDPDVKFLPLAVDGITPIGHSIFVNNSFLEENGDAVSRFLQASYEGYAIADQDLDAHTEVYVAAYPEEGVDLYRESVEAAHLLMHSTRTEENGWGWMELGPWSTLSDLLYRGGALSTEPDLESLFTNDYLPSDAQF